MNDSPSFIETQFPIARLSAESYKERKAVSGQTLTGLGKWWGRKPLILARASILGLLMDASDDPVKDRDIFLKLLTMDDEGVWARRKASLPDRELLIRAPEYKDEWRGADEEHREEIRNEIWEGLDDRARSDLDALRRFPLSRKDFDALPYAERIALCQRPENVEGPSEAAWAEINAHLGTKAASLNDLVLELGKRRFGHRPRVGDAFCGGGSIPFEAARIGCEAYGSDLNPVAVLLTWASLNLVGGGKQVQEEVRAAQEAAFAAAEKQIDEWGIEKSEKGWQAEAYLYCVEVKPEGCEYYIPLAPSWVIAEKRHVCAVLAKSKNDDRLSISILENADDKLWTAAYNRSTGTVNESRVIDPFHPERSWSIESLRGPEGLRLWEKYDLMPQPSDIFQERLYCIRWRMPDGTRVYRSPTEFDLKNENNIEIFLKENIDELWEEGYIPSMALPESGDKTDEPIRTRGWTYWHHLFMPRQIILISCYSKIIEKQKEPLLMLGLGRWANLNSKLCRWLATQGGGIGGGKENYDNQALNPLCNYNCRTILTLQSAKIDFPSEPKQFFPSVITICDARSLTTVNDLWITDPPYADAVNYHELADFFLAWYEKLLPKAFPEWIPDGRKALAVRGSGEDFKRSMVEIYANLTRHMPDNGLQLVMFTHQDPSVWADLGMILWAAGLRVSAAWTIATETPAGGIKKGNYVQGTVLLVLRKRLGAGNAYLDELYPLVEDEVKRQIDAMRELDDASDPNFGDTDYQLAAYAAALRILTQYQSIDDQDVGYELFRAKPEKARGRGRAAAPTSSGAASPRKSRFEQVIDRAIGIACDYLVPRGLEDVWLRLGPDERLYLRSLDVESRGERRQGVYQELARGFGVREVKPILASAAANQTRIKTPSEFGNKDLGPLGAEGFGGTVLRQLLFAVQASRQEESPAPGLRYLKDELVDYWQLRQRLVSMLDWIVPLGKVAGMDDWKEDAEYARLLAGLLRGDHG